MKKMFSLTLALIMALALCVPAFAQTRELGGATGSASITISNAAKGETYSIYKLFDATVAGTGPINYTGTIPESLNTYFTADSAGNITATAAATTSQQVDDGRGGTTTVTEMSTGLKAALKAWAANATAYDSVESDGSALIFAKLPYGYYVVTSSQDGGAAITVDSTNPNASIVDKNSTTTGQLTKTVDDDDVNIGQTVTYTVAFTTSNYDGAGADARRIDQYTITDTLPAFLSNVNVTSIIIDNDADPTTDDDQANVTEQFRDKQIVLDWYDETTNQFRYENGAKVTLVYTAVVTDKAAIDGDGNTNTVTVAWGTDDNDKLTATETIYTYAIALKKVNEQGQALAGATFQLPFYVSTTADANGAYIYAGTTAGEGKTNTLTTPESGEIVVKGVASGDYVITETVAPDGYNKLTAPVTVTATKTGAVTTSVTKYLDANGNVSDTESSTSVTYTNSNLSAAVLFVVNKTGIELPSTGGMGTTIFYTVGGVLMAGAAILLITKKKMSAEE